MRDRGGGWDHKTGSQYDCVLAQQRDICEPTLQTSRKETATNRSSTTRTGTVRYGLKIISFEVTVRTDKDIVVCLTFGHHQISHTHTHKILFLVKLKRNKFQKLVIIILIIFIYISTITVIYQCNSSTFFFYLRF